MASTDTGDCVSIYEILSTRAIFEKKHAIDHYGAVSTFYDDNICETRFSMLCTSYLELTIENCSQ